MDLSGPHSKVTPAIAPEPPRAHREACARGERATRPSSPRDLVRHQLHARGARSWGRAASQNHVGAARGSRAPEAPTPAVGLAAREGEPGASAGPTFCRLQWRRAWGSNVNARGQALKSDGLSSCPSQLKG